MSSVKVTVLMPVYNGEWYVREAIEGVLHQTFRNFEFLIIDDGSTDASPKILEAYRARDPRVRLMTHSQNKQLIATLNEGIAEARGELIARMDADDYSFPERLARQVAFLDSHPHVVAVGTAADLISAEGDITATDAVFIGHETIRRALTVTNALFHGSVMFRKQAVLAAGGYRPEAYLVEDYDLWIRLANLGKLANLPQALYQWRVNPIGESYAHSAEQTDAAQRTADRAWRAYGAAGPAPRSVWPLLWPTYDVRFSEATLHKYALLHILFARGYFRHGQRLVAARHVRAAIRLRPRWWQFYCYLSIACLPRRWFLWLERMGFSIRRIVRRR